MTIYLAIRAWLSACLSGQLTKRMMICFSNLVSGIIMWVPSEGKGFLCQICANSGDFETLKDVCKNSNTAIKCEHMYSACFIIAAILHN